MSRRSLKSGHYIIIGGPDKADLMTCLWRSRSWSEPQVSFRLEGIENPVCVYIDSANCANQGRTVWRVSGECTSRNADQATFPEYRPFAAMYDLETRLGSMDLPLWQTDYAG